MCTNVLCASDMLSYYPRFGSASVSSKRSKAYCSLQRNYPVNWRQDRTLSSTEALPCRSWQEQAPLALHMPHEPTTMISGWRPMHVQSGSNLRRPPYSPPFACTATHPPVKPAPIWMSPYLAVLIFAPNSLHPPSKSRWNKQV